MYNIKSFLKVKNKRLKQTFRNRIKAKILSYKKFFLEKYKIIPKRTFWPIKDEFLNLKNNTIDSFIKKKLKNDYVIDNYLTLLRKNNLKISKKEKFISFVLYLIFTKCKSRVKIKHLFKKEFEKYNIESVDIVRYQTY